MDEIINQIVEIEKRAQAIMQEARDMKDELLSTVHNDIEALKVSYKKRAEDRILIVRENEDKLTAQAIDKIEAEKEEKLTKLQNNYKSNCDSWVETMYSNIVKF